MHDCRAAIAFSYAEKIGRCIPNAAYLHFSILNLYKDQKKKEKIFLLQDGLWFTIGNKSRSKLLRYEGKSGRRPPADEDSLLGLAPLCFKARFPSLKI